MSTFLRVLLARNYALLGANTLVLRMKFSILEKLPRNNCRQQLIVGGSLSAVRHQSAQEGFQGAHQTSTLALWLPQKQTWPFYETPEGVLSAAYCLFRSFCRANLCKRRRTAKSPRQVTSGYKLLSHVSKEGIHRHLSLSERFSS